MITDDVRKRHFDELFMQALGGLEVVDMLYDYYEFEQSYQEIAAARNVPVTTVYRKIAKGRVLLRRIEAMPSHWEARAAKAQRLREIIPDR